MAEKVLRVCDYGEGSCSNPALTFRVWRDGERQAWTLDLCEVHASPLLALVDGAERTDLPVKPRVRMEPTRLRTTAKTAHLKTRE